MLLSDAAKEYIVVVFTSEDIAHEIIHAIEHDSTTFTGTTDDVPEGSINKYFTVSRAAAAAPVQKVNNKTGDVVLNKTDIGLSNVDNTSDADKPIGDATQDALDLKADADHVHDLSALTQSGAANGQVIAWNGTAWAPATVSGGSAVWGGITGDLIDQTDLQDALDAKEDAITAGTISEYFRGDKTFQTLDKSAVGLDQVDNTSDANKPISDATQDALDLKQDSLGFTPENVSNKATNLTSPDDIKYPTAQAVVTALSGKADSAHNHALSDITQSGATSGQVPSWNGTNWVPTTPASASVAWGDITGDLIDQTDLQSALDGKFNNPTGDTTQYIAGDGSLLTFPTTGAADRLVTTVYNQTGATVSKMSVIYLDGPHGNLPKLVLAKADNEVDSVLTYGIIQNNISNMSSGICVEAGRLENLNTNIAGWNEGDVLFLSPTVAGGITNVKPSAPDQLVLVGVLVRKHPTQGVIQVKIQNGYELEELHNVQINGSLANNDTLVYDSATQLWKNSSAKLTKGTKTIFCIDNGDFATGQAAINAASAGDTILFGAKSGGWGDLVIPAGKKLSLKGLQSERAIYVQIGSITFSPTTGTQILENELYIDSLYIYSTTATCLTHGGTAPSRIRVNNCYINAGGAANKGVVFSNTNANSSSYLYNNTIISSAAANIIESSVAYVKAYRNTVDGPYTSLVVSAGTFENNLTNHSVAYAGNAISVTGGSLLCGYSLISNTGANSSGVSVSTGAVFANSYNTFSIPTGAGYCIRGTGFHVYGYMTFANSALLAYNVKVQNTLTNVPYTTAFTLSP
jgi:hypothetical protein